MPPASWARLHVALSPHEPPMVCSVAVTVTSDVPTVMVAESLSAAKLLLVIVAHAVYAVIVSSIMSSIIAAREILRVVISSNFMFILLFMGVIL